MPFVCRAAVAPVLAQASVRAEQVTQLVAGEAAEELAREGEWRRVRLVGDGYEGWVNEGYLLELDAEALARWTRAARAWSEGAVVQTDAGPTHLPVRARAGLGEGAVVLPDGRWGTLAEGRLRDAAEVAREARAVSPDEWAWRTFAGTAYQWGGVTPLGVDCSGLVQTTWAARGVALPRDAWQQASAGEPVDPAALEPGDLCFFRGETTERITHVALYAGSGHLVHSTIACGGVVREPWGPGTRAAPLRERLVAARRVGR